MLIWIYLSRINKIRCLNDDLLQLKLRYVYSSMSTEGGIVPSGSLGDKWMALPVLSVCDTKQQCARHWDPLSLLSIKAKVGDFAASLR